MEEKDIQVIKGAVTEALKPVSQEVKDLATKLAVAEASAKTLADRLEKIERLPAVQDRGFYIKRSSEKFMGFKVAKQFVKFREKALKSHEFEALVSEEAIDEFSKWCIAISKALRNTPDSAEAKQYLRDFYTKANLAEGSGATGGYLVPDEYLWDMCLLGRNLTFALRECTVIPMGTDQKYVPAELTMASVAWTTPETGQMTAGEPTFAQVSLTAKRLDGIATVTNELLQDSYSDVSSLLAEQFGYAVALELDNQVLSGTGTPVSGLTTAACGYSVVMATGSTNFSAVTADHFSEAIYKLSQGDTLGAMFIINRIGKHYVRKLKDNNGQYIFANPGGGVPGTVWEYPYFESSKITDTSAVSTALAVFGNFRKYYIGRRMNSGTTLDVDPYGKFDYNQTRFRIVTRWALAAGRSSAFCRIITAAA